MAVATRTSSKSGYLAESYVHDDATLLTDLADKSKIDDRWNKWIDRPLIDWGLGIDGEDDEFVPPSPASVRVACEMSRTLRDQQTPAPDRIIPNGDGGIVFRWGKPGERFQSLEVFADGRCEYSCSENFKVVEKFTLFS